MFRWGIIGLGSIAEDFAKVITEENGYIQGVSNRTYEKAIQFSKNYKVKKIYKYPQELLSSSEIDIVYISTPNNTHYEYIKEALLNDKHVLCEKAITMSIDELKEVNEIAKERNLVLAEAMTVYNMPIYKYLKENYIESLGKLKLQQISFGSKKPYDINNRFFSKELGGGAMLDIGTYAISMANVFLEDDIEDVLSFINTAESGVDDISTIILKSKNNVLTTINLSFTAKMPKRAVIGFEKGYIEIEDYPRADKAKIVYATGETVEVSKGNSSKALIYEFKMMEKVVKDKKYKETNMSKTIKTIKVMSDLL